MKRNAVFIPFVVFGLCVFVFKNAIERRLVGRAAKHPPLPIEEAAYEGHSLKRFSLGFDNLIADAIWISLLQKASHEPIASGAVSWEYAELAALITLD